MPSRGSWVSGSGPGRQAWSPEPSRTLGSEIQPGGSHKLTFLCLVSPKNIRYNFSHVVSFRADHVVNRLLGLGSKVGLPVPEGTSEY